MICTAQKGRTSKKIVVVRIQGGLGNQLFQYAAGVGLTEQLGAELLVDTSGFINYPLRKYHLSDLSRFAQDWGLGRPTQGLAGRMRMARQSSTPQFILKHARILIHQERFFHYKPIPDWFKNAIYLDGFWQSPKYFASVAERIRSLYDPSQYISKEESTLADSLSSTASVAIHVRRGDYISDAETCQIHGVIGTEWYRYAVDLARRIDPALQLHVFSDDPAEARQIFDGFVGIEFHPPRSEWADLKLMASCRHRIIANSTFSWWAAWMATSGYSIAPRNWFSREKLLNTSIIDLCPQGWLLV